MDDEVGANVLLVSLGVGANVSSTLDGCDEAAAVVGSDKTGPIVGVPIPGLDGPDGDDIGEVWGSASGVDALDGNGAGPATGLDGLDGGLSGDSGVEEGCACEESGLEVMDARIGDGVDQPIADDPGGDRIGGVNGEGAGPTTGLDGLDGGLSGVLEEGCACGESEVRKSLAGVGAPTEAEFGLGVGLIVMDARIEDGVDQPTADGPVGDGKGGFSGTNPAVGRRLGEDAEPRPRVSVGCDPGTPSGTTRGGVG